MALKGSPSHMGFGVTNIAIMATIKETKKRAMVKPEKTMEDISNFFISNFILDLPYMTAYYNYI